MRIEIKIFFWGERERGLPSRFPADLIKSRGRKEQDTAQDKPYLVKLFFTVEPMLRVFFYATQAGQGEGAAEY
jgi:hypothetical protein